MKAMQRNTFGLAVLATALMLVATNTTGMIGVPDDTASFGDKEALLLPPGHAAVAQVTLTPQGPDLTLTAVPVTQAFGPGMTLQADEHEQPNCLTETAGSVNLGNGNLSVSGESFEPLIEAGVATPCGQDSFEIGFAEATLVTSGEGSSGLEAFFSSGFLFNLFSIDCEGTGVGHGSTSDPTLVECESHLQGPVETIDWSGYRASVYRDEADGNLTFGALDLV